MEEMKQTPTVVVKKIISADRERVFDAWTKPELMNHWYVGGKGRSISAVDLRVGGKFSNEMLIEGDGTCSHSQTGSCETKSYMHTGEYLEIVRPEKLVFTWNSPSVTNTKVTVILREVEQGTEVTITHELPNLDVCEGHRGGWTFALNTLATFVG